MNDQIVHFCDAAVSADRGDPLGHGLYLSRPDLGLLALFRHNGSLGGLGVIALMIQDTTGFRAGWVQLVFDGFLFGLVFCFFDATVVMYSLLGAMVLNLIIAINLRRDRYVATKSRHKKAPAFSRGVPCSNQRAFSLQAGGLRR
jgi:hypothetical protein